MIEEDKELESLGVRFFSQIFKDDGQTNIAAQMKVIRLFPSFLHLHEDLLVFSNQITMEEVEHAMKSFKKDKSSSPDGWSVEFFLAFLDLLGTDLLDMVESSRLEGRVLPSLNSTFLALIPKKEKPLTFAEFRPMSLCNLVYKLISKCYSSSEALS